MPPVFIPEQSQAVASMDSPLLDPNNDRQRDFFQQLPDEILVHIFHFLNASDLMTLGLVSHRIRTISSDCYKRIKHHTLVLDSAPEIPNNVSAKMLFKHRRVLELIGPTLLSLNVVFSLKVRKNQNYIDKYIKINCKKLRHLTYNDRVIWILPFNRALQYLQYLKTLIFIHPFMNQMDSFVENAPNLTTFKIVEHVGSMILGSIRDLFVTIGFDIKTQMIFYFPRNICNVETHHLNIPMSVFKDISKTFGKLKNLRLLNLTVIDCPTGGKTLNKLRMPTRLERFELISRNKIDVANILWMNAKDVVQVPVEEVGRWSFVGRR